MSLRLNGESIYAAAARIADAVSKGELLVEVEKDSSGLLGENFEKELIKVRGLSVEQQISELLKEV